MIPIDYITEWRQRAKWAQDSQVEQDLIISRALIEIFQQPEVGRALAFRGGTALYKLHFSTALRYSEDIDLVQGPGLPEAAKEPLGIGLANTRARLERLHGDDYQLPIPLAAYLTPFAVRSTHGWVYRSAPSSGDASLCSTRCFPKTIPDTRIVAVLKQRSDKRSFDTSPARNPRRISKSKTARSRRPRGLDGHAASTLSTSSALSPRRSDC